MEEHIQESGAGFQVLGLVSLMPSPSCAEREKGSGEKSRTTISLRNAIIGILVCVK